MPRFDTRELSRAPSVDAQRDTVGSAAGRIAASAATLTAPRAFNVRPVALPSPAAGTVRIQLEGSGVCASSIPVWEGRDWFTYPREPGSPGHEGWGYVDAVGEGVTTVKVGDRVAVLSYRAFASFDVAPEDQVVRLPDTLSRMPFPGEPLGCAFNVFRRSAIEPGHDVAIVGIGFLGAILTRLAAHAGARVIAVSRRRFSLDLAREFGAAETVEMDDHHSVIERVRRLTGGALCARVIEAVGLQRPLDLAGELTAERGRLVIAGFHQDGLRQLNVQLWNWRGIDVINAHERDPAMYTRGMREAVDAISAGVLDPTPLYTHRYSLGELDRAFADTVSRPDGFLKAIVCP